MSGSRRQAVPSIDSLLASPDRCAFLRLVMLARLSPGVLSSLLTGASGGRPIYKQNHPLSNSLGHSNYVVPTAVRCASCRSIPRASVRSWQRMIGVSSLTVSSAEAEGLGAGWGALHPSLERGLSGAPLTSPEARTR